MRFDDDIGDVIVVVIPLPNLICCVVLVRVNRLNVGDDIVAISWGVDIMMLPDALVIVIWFDVPVRCADIGDIPDRPISICPDPIVTPDIVLTPSRYNI